MVIAEIEILKLFLLVFARFGGLMVSAPVLGSQNFPAIAKIGLAGLAALIITPTLPALPGPLPAEAMPFAVIGAEEFLIGLLVGFVMGLVFAAIQLGGQIMDMQTGFGMMNVFNPAMETQFPIFGFLLFILGVMYLLVIQGHHLMIRALIATYEHVPIGGIPTDADLYFKLASMGSLIFVDGIMLAAPVATAMLLAYLTMGLLGRVVPQIQLFVVGFPVTIATGLIVIAFAMGVYIEILDGMFYRSFGAVEQLIKAMG
ncbi:MAG: flagellar biosynthetic protein FliR [Candidatus Hydrogenedens sp.]|nr:flagellar biosynthetic protein FliR [Candidatus Hydrogenedens sp.]